MCLTIFNFIGGGGIFVRYIIGFVSRAILGEIHGEGLLLAYNSVIVFPASGCLFMAFKYLDIKNKIMEKVSVSFGALCFGVYLATDNDLIREQLWKTINLPGLYKYGMSIQVVFIVLTVISLFAVGCLLEKARIMIFRITFIQKFFGYIDSKFVIAIAEMKTALEEGKHG